MIPPLWAQRTYGGRLPPWLCAGHHPHSGLGQRYQPPALLHCVQSSYQTEDQKGHADKGYTGKPNRDFLALNQIEDGIMRKNSTTAKLTELEIQRNKAISKIRYIVEQYFGISHLHGRANRTRFTTIVKNKFDTWFRQAAFNVARGMKILSRMTV
jgi:hypothetical protein